MGIPIPEKNGLYIARRWPSCARPAARTLLVTDLEMFFPNVSWQFTHLPRNIFQLKSIPKETNFHEHFAAILSRGDKFNDIDCGFVEHTHGRWYFAQWESIVSNFQNCRRIKSLFTKFYDKATIRHTLHNIVSWLINDGWLYKNILSPSICLSFSLSFSHMYICYLFWYQHLQIREIIYQTGCK